MNPLQIPVTGSEALEMIQQQFPKKWESMVEEAKHEIKSYMRIFGTDAVTAYQKYITTVNETNVMIITLAALYVMNKTYVTSLEIKKLQDEQRQCGIQMIALEGMTNILPHEKQELRAYYPTKQDELQRKIDQLIASIPVVGMQSIQIETGQLNKAS